MAPSLILQECKQLIYVAENKNNIMTPSPEDIPEYNKIFDNTSVIKFLNWNSNRKAKEIKHT